MNDPRVYFGKNTGNGYTKIGYTARFTPEDRLWQLQPGYHGKLVLLGSVQAYHDEASERWFHRRFRHCRVYSGPDVHGREWFSVDEEDIVKAVEVYWQKIECQEVQMEFEFDEMVLSPYRPLVSRIAKSRCIKLDCPKIIAGMAKIWPAAA